jgi:hypothetical protein
MSVRRYTYVHVYINRCREGEGVSRKRGEGGGVSRKRGGDNRTFIVTSEFNGLYLFLS